MEDRVILERIDEMVREEHDLREVHEREGLGPVDQGRLERLEIELDRCWDLLRQRRARRGAGLDPDDAEARASDTVEDYQQ